MRGNDAEKIPPGLVFHLSEESTGLRKDNRHSRQNALEAEGIETVKGLPDKSLRGNQFYIIYLGQAPESYSGQHHNHQ